MKIILSRKGFDSSYGGVASPILPDGTLLSLPIPVDQSPMTYGDLRWNGSALGPIVEDLTHRRNTRTTAAHPRKPITRNTPAHLDPDLDPRIYPRQPGWRPLFGQDSAAQSHLAGQGVGIDDLFLFFGWFRQTEQVEGHYRFVVGAPNLHVIYGWLQIGEIWHVGDSNRTIPPWALYHPHVHDASSPHNTIYVASETLQLEGRPLGLPGAGVLPRYNPALCLTAPGGLRTRWRLPRWCSPRNDCVPFTYNGAMSRWQLQDDHVLLQSAYRGQEFVLDTEQYPEAVQWVRDLLLSTQVAT
jgi:hypothetical protein